MKSFKTVAWGALILGALFSSGCGRMCLSVTQVGNETRDSETGKVSALFQVRTCGGDPVADLSNSNFRVDENDKPASPYESQYRVEPAPQAFSLQTVLNLDVSGSVKGQLPTLQASAQQFVTDLYSGVDVQNSIFTRIYAFNGLQERTPLNMDFSNQPATLSAAIASLSCKPNSMGKVPAYCTDDSTNLYGAVYNGLRELAAQKRKTPSSTQGGLNFVRTASVVFTDGTERANWVTRKTVDDEIASEGQNDTLMYTIGLGAEIDKDILGAFGRSGFFYAAGLDDLKTAFQKAAARLRSEARSVYRLDFCPAARSGEVKIKVVAKDPGEGQPAGEFTFEINASANGGKCKI